MAKEYGGRGGAPQESGPRPRASPANLDEAYPFMQVMGWMQESTGGNQFSCCPSQNSSKLDALMGTGKAPARHAYQWQLRRGTRLLQQFAGHWQLIKIHIE